MKEITEQTENAIKAEAVAMLIKNHLSWSGSDENMPSKDKGYVEGWYIDRMVCEMYEDAEYDALSDEAKQAVFCGIAAKFEAAKAQADAKWLAAKFLLGI